MRIGNIIAFGTALSLLAACGGDGRDTMDSSPGSADAGETGESMSGDGDGDGDGVIFDVGEGMESGGDEGGGPCNCGEDEWSYLWVANTAEHTVSKIDTRSLEEKGRYMTRPDGAGNPSRTSVSIDGRAMVVANRHGGVTKVWARPQFCANDGANTSTGADDVKAWGDDDCVAWHAPFDGFTTQRPVQWTPGTLNETTCEYYDQKVWTVAGQGGSAGTCGTGPVSVFLLDGDDGEIEEQDTLNDVACSAQALYNNLGPYGAAVDFDGNLYFHVFDSPTLVRVDIDTFEHEKFTMPHNGYGILVDNGGKVWINRSFNVGMISRFDPDTKTFKSADVGGKGGIAQDHDGRIWTANGNDGIAALDRETLALGPEVIIPGNNPVKGVSVDIDGYIWGIKKNQDVAYRVDPDSYELEGYQGLNKPYTYSDMTGGALANNTCNPAPEG
jgi:hypothetical protein